MADAFVPTCIECGYDCRRLLPEVETCPECGGRRTLIEHWQRAVCVAILLLMSGVVAACLGWALASARISGDRRDVPLFTEHRLLDTIPGMVAVGAAWALAALAPPTLMRVADRAVLAALVVGVVLKDAIIPFDLYRTVRLLTVAQFVLLGWALARVIGLVRAARATSGANLGIGWLGYGLAFGAVVGLVLGRELDVFVAAPPGLPTWSSTISGPPPTFSRGQPLPWQEDFSAGGRACLLGLLALLIGESTACLTRLRTRTLSSR